MSQVLSDQLEAFIRGLPERDKYDREDLLVEAIKLAEEPSENLVVYDAPLGWMNHDARLVLIGVTPGFTQMELAYRAVRRHLLTGKSGEEACRRAKMEASFGGAMRANLIQMLDEIGTNMAFGVSSSAELFETTSRLLHTTSVVRYPTFIGKRNYTGSRPAMIHCPFLMHFARETLAPELSLFPNALFVPLGRSVGPVIGMLESENRIPAGRTLHGFPHPSGANGHRKRQFNTAREELKQQLKAAV